MKRLLGLLVLAALPLSAATISGTVTPPAMTVQAWDAAGTLKASATADGAGRYTLTLTAGSYHVLAFDPAGVYATSFYADAASFETSALVKTDATNINLALVRGGFIAGSVNVPGAVVAAYNADGTRRGFTHADAGGHYRLVLPPGTYRVAAYDEAQDFLTSVFASPVTVVVAATETVDFDLARGAVVSGTVTPRATVSLYANGVVAAETTSGDDGRYRLLVPPGVYRVVIFDRNGVYATKFYPDADSFEAAAAIALAAGETRTIDAQLVAGGRFAGTVTDTSGAPLAGITVAAFNASGTTRGFTLTDAAGHYSLLLPPGNYRVGAYDIALIYLRRFYPNVISFVSAPPWSIFAAQTTMLDFALPRGAVFSGTVIDQSSLGVLAGITVGAYDATGLVASAVTDAMGHYRLLLEPGSYRLAAFDTAFRYVTRSALSAPTTDFALARGAHLTGSVADVAGAAVAGAVVAAYDAAGVEVASAVTRGDGTFDLVAPAATLRFAAYDPQLRYAASALTPSYALSVGQVAALTFQLRFNAAPARHRATRH